MYKKKKILGVVPARIGSKGIRKKNIRHFRKKPLVHYAIDASLHCPEIDKVILSSDSDEIIDVCTGFDNLEIDHRPKELSGDDSTSVSVLKYLLNKEKLNNIFYDIVILVQATNPLVIPQDISGTVRKHVDMSLDSCFTISKLENFSPSKFFSLGDENLLKPFFDVDPGNSPRQYFSSAYTRNGSCYSFSVSHLFSENPWAGKSGGFLVPKERSVDIDDELDFYIGESLHRRFFS